MRRNPSCHQEWKNDCHAPQEKRRSNVFASMGAFWQRVGIGANILMQYPDESPHSYDETESPEQFTHISS
jgi:hypothetical protein